MSTSPGTRFPSASTISTPFGVRSATSASPPQRERRDADGDDLRLALPAADPPLRDDRRQSAGDFLWDAKTTGEQIGRYASLCAHDASCRARTPDLAASIHAAYTHMPDHWWFLPIRKGNVRLGAFFGLMHATTDGAGPLNGPWTIDTLLAADDGNGSGAWLLSLMTQAIFPRAQVWGDVAAVGRADAAHARRFFAAQADRGSVIGSPGTDFITAGGGLFDSWPASPDENLYTRVRSSNVETLLIGGRLDVATPPQNATRQLLPHLSNGHEVVLPDIGHTDDFWTYQTPAGNRLINTFLDSGRIDTSLYTRTPVDFTPALGQGTIAEIVLGAMLALAALTVSRSCGWRSACGGAVPSDARAASCSAPCFRSCSGWAACSSAS